MKAINNKIQQLAVLLGIALSMVLFQNCSGGFDTSGSALNINSNAEGNGLYLGEVNSKPKLDCTISSGSRDSVYQRMSVFNDEFSTDRFNIDDSLSIDCGDTQDESVLSSIKFEIDTDYDPAAPQFVAMSTNSVDLSFAAPGIHNVAVKATDPQGEAIIKAASVVVECAADAPSPSINNPSSAISVAAGSEMGLFNYTINAGAVSGGDGFKYAWDFNGDNVFDPFEVKAQGSVDIWTADTLVEDQYSNLVNNRKLGLKIRNSCMKESKFNVTLNLDTSAHPVARNATSIAVITPYYYLQGDVKSLTPGLPESEESRREADYLATDRSGKTNFQCIVQNNNGKSSLTIATTKKYRTADMNIGGMEIRIKDITEPGTDGEHIIGVNDGQSVDKLYYSIGGEPDGIAQDSFSKTQDCSVKLRIIRSTSVNPCDDGSSVEEKSHEVLGEFTCPELSNTLGQKIAVENGKFYCGYSFSDRCQGGGGGGGGGQPPVEY